MEKEPGKKVNPDLKRAIRADVQDGVIAGINLKDEPDPEIQGLVYINGVPVLREDQEDIIWSGRKNSSS